MRKFVIGDNFIKKWHPKYDGSEIGGDYVEYETLIKEVSKEVSQGIISKPTSIRILDWKAPRVKGIVRLNNFDYYVEGIKRALQAPEDCKLQILDELYGIGSSCIDNPTFYVSVTFSNYGCQSSRSFVLFWIS